MNVVYCTDNQFMQVEVSMCSLFETNEPTQCKVYLLVKEITNGQELHLKKLAEYYGGSYETILVNENLLPFLKVINDENGMHQGFGKLLPSAAYYRWLIPHYLPNVERCLYLDTDVIVNRNLTEVYNVEFNGASIIGQIINKELLNEIMVGTILINIPLWNENGLLDKCISKTLNNYSNNDRINDQYILNEIIHDKYKIINTNLFTCCSDVIMTRNELNQYYLIHYCGYYRPWTLKGGRISEIGKPWKNTEYWWKYYDIRNIIFQKMRM